MKMNFLQKKETEFEKLIREYKKYYRNKDNHDELNLTMVKDICEAIYTYAKPKAEDLKKIAEEMLQIYWGELSSIDFEESSATAKHLDGRRVILFNNKKEN